MEMYNINVNASAQGLSKVVLNGNYIAFTSVPLRLVKELRGLRRSGIISDFISISFEGIYKEVRILTDGGRMMRPLLIV